MAINLRPVEALCLLSITGDEAITEENSLDAVIKYLIKKGYAEENDERGYMGVINTDKNVLSVRQYEEFALRSISIDDSKAFLESTMPKMVRKNLVENGYIKRNKIFGFPNLLTPYSATVKGTQAIHTLVRLRESNKNLANPDQLFLEMKYAFPSLNKNQRKDCDDVSVRIYEEAKESANDGWIY